MDDRSLHTCDPPCLFVYKKDFQQMLFSPAFLSFPRLSAVRSIKNGTIFSDYPAFCGGNELDVAKVDAGRIDVLIYPPVPTASTEGCRRCKTNGNRYYHQKKYDRSHFCRFFHLKIPRDLVPKNETSQQAAEYRKKYKLRVMLRMQLYHNKCVESNHLGRVF